MIFTCGLPATHTTADDHDLLVQLFARADIDMDHFIATEGPDARHHCRTVAADPYASAKFFHKIVRIVFQMLSRIDVGRN